MPKMKTKSAVKKRFPRDRFRPSEGRRGKEAPQPRSKIAKNEAYISPHIRAGRVRYASIAAFPALRQIIKLRGEKPWLV